MSAYKDKLTKNNDVYEESWGSYILTQIRPGADNKTKAAGKGVTFHEFIKYYIKHTRGISYMQDRHFQNFQKACFPCIVKFDYIAKFETQDVDAQYIINEKLSGRGASDLLKAHSNRAGASMFTNLPEYNNITAKELEDMKDALRWDMNMFGYSIEYHNGSFHGKCGLKDECC